MLIGHNPGFEEFLAELIGEYESLPTAAIAVVELPLDTWSDLTRTTSGRLLQLWRPRELET